MIEQTATTVESVFRAALAGMALAINAYLIWRFYGADIARWWREKVLAWWNRQWVDRWNAKWQIETDRDG